MLTPEQRSWRVKQGRFRCKGTSLSQNNACSFLSNGNHYWQPGSYSGLWFDQPVTESTCRSILLYHKCPERLSQTKMYIFSMFLHPWTPLGRKCESAMLQRRKCEGATAKREDATGKVRRCEGEGAILL